MQYHKFYGKMSARQVVQVKAEEVIEEATSIWHGK